MVHTFLATLAKYLPFFSSDQSDAALSVEAINFSTFCPNAKVVASVIYQKNGGYCYKSSCLR